MCRVGCIYALKPTLATHIETTTVERVCYTFDNCQTYKKPVSSVAKRHLLPEDVVKLQNFQQKKLAVAHLLNGTEGDAFLLFFVASQIQFCPFDTQDKVSSCTGNFIQLFSQKLQRNELILRDELKLLLHLCQTAEDVAVARDAIHRWSTTNCLVSIHPSTNRH